MPDLNIDYAAIIEKADARRAKLQRLQELLSDTDTHVKALLVARDHFVRLNTIRESLDPEGIALIGPFASAIYAAATLTNTCVSNLTAVLPGKPSPLAVLSGNTPA